MHIGRHLIFILCTLFNQRQVVTSLISDTNMYQKHYWSTIWHYNIYKCVQIILLKPTDTNLSTFLDEF